MYDESVKDTVCEKIAEGESLRGLCSKDGMPSWRTVMDWLKVDETFRSKYAQAREDQADTLFDEFSELEAQVLSGEVKPDAARVVFQSRQWRAEKLKPKKYGAKVSLAGHDGGDLLAGLTLKVVGCPAKER